MKFNYLSLFPVLIFIWIVYITLSLKVEKKFFNLVKRFWYLGKTRAYRISKILYHLSVILLFISLLDIRNIRNDETLQDFRSKTLILLDASTSMLADDVLPNRFLKSIFLAKHLVRNTNSASFGILIFSDKTVLYTPFTTDREFLITKLDNLSTLKLRRGGSNISMALKEGLAYLRENGGQFSGNLVVFSDFEETRESVRLEVPSAVKLAMIGVGSQEGSTFPSSDWVTNQTNKKYYNGHLVVSKVSLSFLENLQEKIPSSHYWIVDKDIIYTQEIKEFLKTKFGLQNTTVSIKSSQIYSIYLAGLALLIMIISLVFKRKEALTLLNLFIWLTVPYLIKTNEVMAMEFNQAIYLKKFYNGELNDNGKLRLAHSYLISREKEKAIKIYDEIFNETRPVEEYPMVAFNYATLLILNKRAQEGFAIYNLLQKLLSANEIHSPTLLQNIRNNSLLALTLMKNERKRKLGGQKQQKSGQSGQEDQKMAGKEGKNSKEKKGKIKFKKLKVLLEKLINDDRIMQSRNIFIKNFNLRGPNDLKDW